MNKKSDWTLEKIKEGFDKFQAEYGRLPTASEIDVSDDLPSSRQIQRKFGGLEKLRERLGYEDTHFGKGVFRSQIATKSNVRGRDVEVELEKALIEKFGEVFVHTEKIFDSSKNRVDFYIYSPDGAFGVDVFFTETMKDLQKNINIKIDKYKNFPVPLFFVVGSNMFSQKELDDYLKSKQKSLPTNCTYLINLDTLKNIIRNKKSYPNPLCN